MSQAPHGTTTGHGGHRALAVVRAPARAAAAVLVLHGGRSDDRSPARPWQLAALRMRPFLGALARELPADEVLLGRVRYRYRGWNAPAADPLTDTLAALDEVVRRAGDVPIVLVGHSMGGRAALRAAGHPAVTGVVALAPWWPEGEPVRQLDGRRVVLLHGDRDRVTSSAASLALGGRAREAGARTAALLLNDEGHAMLGRARVWHDTAARSAAGLLAYGPLPEPVEAAFAAPSALPL
ncbi:alpha/beta hydrolase [Streptomyces montanisoli]|uniref:Alpha/beta fold hydrolase n=1 Tax=Streptomyces montanisoli TaxID=2798581 RepID=A0A940MF75_9ACTN|nr:alpha/beta fold hydrolase [Streptomyces montanisoli]MBP0461954.1 alpha/beta fold hydrolase [Streptomyces montanisoli]